MTMVRMPNMYTFLEDLLHSLKYYDKVYQAKKYNIDDFFEDHASFMIDTTVSCTVREEVQPLSRLFFLSSWDVYVPDTYRSAPPVCHFFIRIAVSEQHAPFLPNASVSNVTSWATLLVSAERTNSLSKVLFKMMKPARRITVKPITTLSISMIKSMTRYQVQHLSSKIF
ncbi:hypothetical protein PS15m_005722 [Mucor circinelloides]